jgi:hypothetical protein
VNLRSPHGSSFADDADSLASMGTVSRIMPLLRLRRSCWFSPLFLLALKSSSDLVVIFSIIQDQSSYKIHSIKMSPSIGTLNLKITCLVIDSLIVQIMESNNFTLWIIDIKFPFRLDFPRSITFFYPRLLNTFTTLFNHSHYLWPVQSFQSIKYLIQNAHFHHHPPGSGGRFSSLNHPRTSCSRSRLLQRPHHRLRHSRPQRSLFPSYQSR